LLKSGLLPPSIKTAEAALFIILTGRDLGLSPVQSLRSIHIIQGRREDAWGKVELSADLQLGLFQRQGGTFKWVRLNETGAQLELTAPWLNKPHVSTFGPEEARRAELMSQATYRKYPVAMFRSRAITQGLKDIGFLITAGLYAPGELGGAVTVDEATGEVLPANEPMREITSTAGTVEALDDQERESLENHALTISENVRGKQMEAALNDWHSLDNDQKVAVWAMLDKAVRKDLKAADKAAREAGPPAVVYAPLIEKMASRKDVDLLDADADLIDQLPTLEQQTDATAEYVRLRSVLVAK
jgi:hypothetical protein